MATVLKESTPRSDTPLERIWAEIRHHKIERYIAELDVQGFTVIPPEIATPNGLGERMLEACLDIAERRNGVRPDLVTGATHQNFREHQFGEGLSPLGADQDSPIGDLMPSVIFDDQVFEEALMNPVFLTLASYLCGYSVVAMSGMSCIMKGPNQARLVLHTDTPLPSPLLSYAVVCNLTYALTEFSRENGSTAFVPGSHRWCRIPTLAEMDLDGHPDAVAVEAAPGSLVVWHGNTWHGAYNRTAPGLRVSVPAYMSRPALAGSKGPLKAVPKEMLERNDPRFGWLMHQGMQGDPEQTAKYLAAINEISGSRGGFEMSLYS